jgi:hypothetical protein
VLRLGIGLGYLPNFVLMEDMTILDDQLSEGFRLWELNRAGEKVLQPEWKYSARKRCFGKN